MTSLRSVVSQKSSNGRSKLTLLGAISPIFCLVPNTVDTDQDTLNEAPTDVDMTPVNSDMVEEQLKDTYESVMQQFNNSEFAPHLKAAVRAAAKKFVDMSTSPSSPTDPPDLVSILVECLKTELEEGGVYTREVAVLSDGSWLSSVREWAQGLGSINWGPALLLCGLLGALPLASGVTAGDNGVPPVNESIFQDNVTDPSEADPDPTGLYAAARAVQEESKAHPLQTAIGVALLWLHWMRIRMRAAWERPLR